MKVVGGGAQVPTEAAEKPSEEPRVSSSGGEQGSQQRWWGPRRWGQLEMGSIPGLWGGSKGSLVARWCREDQGAGRKYWVQALTQTPMAV